MFNASSHRWSTLRGGWKTWSCPGSILPRRWGWITETWGHCLVCTWWVLLWMKRKWERNTTVVEPFFVTLWFFKVEAGHSVSRLYFLYLYVCVCVCFWGELSDGSARCWLRRWTPALEKPAPLEPFILVIIPPWWDFFMFMTWINKVVMG